LRGTGKHSCTGILKDHKGYGKELYALKNISNLFDTNLGVAVNFVNNPDFDLSFEKIDEQTAQMR